MTRRTLAALAVATLLGTSGAAAQSVSSLRGLGYPLLPTDARSEVLGGLGIGLKGLSAPLTNPASAASVVQRGGIISVATVRQNAELGDFSEVTGATRFPLVRLLYPVGPAVLTAGYGGYLDQAWGVERQGTAPVGGTQASYSDELRSTGGVGQFQVGAAIPLGSRLAVGVAVGAHTGSQRVEFRRLFDSTAVGSLQPFTDAREWQYLGPMAQVGVRWDPVDILRLGASVTWAGTLSADSAAGTATDHEYDLPLQVAAGASAYLAPGILAAVSGRWSEWSRVGPVFGVEPGGETAAQGRDTWEIGGGLELDDPERRATHSFPLRVGFQYRQLPFRFTAEPPTEWFVGGGVGMRIGASAENPLARVDFTVQRGERTAPGATDAATLTETAWRAGLTIAIFGT